MALPILETPQFETSLPSDNKKVIYRPFTVKEQKNLMIAQTGGNEKEAIKALAQCLNMCVIGENIAIEKRPIIDFEWLFLQVRGKSVGEVAELSSSCIECGAIFDFEFDLKNVTVPKLPNNKIKVNNDLVIGFDYVSLNDIIKSNEQNDIVSECARTIFYKNETYTEFTKEEFLKFIEPLTLAEYEPIDNYFKIQPGLRLKTKQKCFKCGHTNDVAMEGVFNFFQ